MTHRSIDVTIALSQQGDRWIGVAQEFPVSDFGSTMNEALARTADAATAWVKANISAGQIDKMAQVYEFTIKDVDEFEPERPQTTVTHRVPVSA